MICTSITTLIVAMALSYVWLFNETREKATGWWCLSMWTGMFATAVLATRTILPAWFSLGLGNMGVALAFGLVWGGYEAFAGRSPSYRAVSLGAVVWTVSYYGFDAFRHDVNNRIIISAIVCSAYSMLVVRRAMISWREEQLPSFLATTVFFIFHSAAYLVRIPLAIFYPATEQGGVIHAPWFGMVGIEGFTVTVFSSFVFMALIKERAERRYKLAAEIDSLTSASSRRHFVSETRAALARQPKSAFLSVLDLDFFKKINDTYGHMAGDKALQAFAHYISSQLQPGMVFGRLGGEEFGLFMPDCDEAVALDFLERLRGGVESLDIRFNGNVFKVTTSIGMAGVDETGYDFDNLMAGADNALYLAKEQGRNRACLFSSAMRLERILQGDGRESRVSLAENRISRISVRSRPGRT
jgi:diguanylate cyclase (GGDEF)-like protein